MSISTQKPILFYDNDCRFCRIVVGYWKHITGEHVEYRPFQTSVPQDSVRLEMPSGKHYTGAEAVFRTFAIAGTRRYWLWLYTHEPGFRTISQGLYRLVSRFKKYLYTPTAFIFGKNPTPPTYAFSTWLFLRLLGIVYFIAFASFIPQALGLIGKNGITPVANLLQNAPGFFTHPTLFTFNASDTMIHVVIALGILASLLLIAGTLPRVMLGILFILYLSLINGSLVFLSFQWDILLLEAGFFALFLSPKKPLSIKLMWWLLFRLMFFSGLVKLMSGDPVWRDFTALTYHFETQPLPTLFAWYMHQLPTTLLKIGTLGMFVVELVFAFVIFLPGRLRLGACGAFILLQVVIFITGNYTFFNILAIALTLTLISDTYWTRVIPQKLFQKISAPIHSLPAKGIALILVIYIIISFFPLNALRPFHIINNYGLFAVMTKTRPEIIIEGSRDGNTWKPYSFRYKPDVLSRAPKWVQPHQPRLDWQLWFAALGTKDQNPWFTNLVVRLLEGSPEVLGLFKENPFPDSPPRFIRARRFEYTFTDTKTRKQTGNWWARSEIDLYFPQSSLE